MSAFVALLSLDARRQDSSRCDVLCCVPVKNATRKKKSNGFLLPLMRDYYAPFLLHSTTRIIVDSYMLDYFKYLYKYFEVGMPTYFVTTRGYNFSSIEGMNGVCSSVGCNNNSMTQKIQYATTFPKESFLAIPASSWVDDFIDWLNPISKCCRLHSFGPQQGKFCPSTSTSRFMAYHTPLTNSQAFTEALRRARELADNITRSMRQIPGTDPNFQVFPYTITYVYFEQYLTIVSEGIFILSLCLLPTFVVCSILLGMDVRSGLLNLITIIMITVDTVGVMTLWSIDYNAVSLINLVTAVGISVEFVSHLTRSFAISTQPNHLERAKEATANMGSAVFAGVAMTNLPGIIVLAFAKAQLIQIFFFRLNLVITLLGMLHGLVFLPVLLSYFGKQLVTDSTTVVTSCQ
ncbi:UNVERIFIED_CONTAM: hypothetical protein FKN15_012859 [Acipenser sinensis]